MRIFVIIILAMLNGEVAVPCNSQTAIARLNSCGRVAPVEPPETDYVEVWVPRNGTL